MPTLVEKTKQVLLGMDSVAAAYLFGSATHNSSNVVNDIDLLILVAPESDPFKVLYQVTTRIAKTLNISTDILDVLIFDLRLADPEVIYQAVSDGVLLKDTLPELLGAHIEELSLYFLAGEYLNSERKRLQQEMMEGYVNG